MYGILPPLPPHHVGHLRRPPPYSRVAPRRPLPLPTSSHHVGHLRRPPSPPHHVGHLCRQRLNHLHEGTPALEPAVAVRQVTHVQEKVQRVGAMLTQDGLQGCFGPAGGEGRVGGGRGVDTRAAAGPGGCPCAPSGLSSGLHRPCRRGWARGLRACWWEIRSLPRRHCEGRAAIASLHAPSRLACPSHWVLAGSVLAGSISPTGDSHPPLPTPPSPFRPAPHIGFLLARYFVSPISPYTAKDMRALAPLAGLATKE